LRAVSRSEHLIGLTPVIKRVAHYYLQLGHGEYHPDHPHYDRVVVRPLYDFQENPEAPGEFAGGTIIEFFQRARRVRWVEFRCQVVGGGGSPIVRRVEP
jgi:hypothetical protein